MQGDGELFRFPVAIVPEAGLLRGGTEVEGYTWMAVSANAVGEYRRITRGLEPLPAHEPTVRLRTPRLPRREHRPRQRRRRARRVSRAGPSDDDGPPEPERPFSATGARARRPGPDSPLRSREGAVPEAVAR